MTRRVQTLLLLSVLLVLSGCRWLADPSYEITGQVVDQDGRGLEGVLIETQGRSTESDVDGYWSLSGLRGPNLLTFTKEHWEFDQTELTVDEGEEPVIIIGTLRKPQTPQTPPIPPPPVLTLRTLGRGQILPSVPAKDWKFGDWIELTAQPQSGWAFVGWEGPVSGSGTKVGVRLERDQTVRAIFDPIVTLYHHEQRRVLQIPLEEYIIGVVAAEMPASWELEALKAQALAARTYVVRRMKILGGPGGGPSGADVSNSGLDSQAWKSRQELQTFWGKDFQMYWNKITRAVRETRGQVITYNGQLITAYYHSTAGDRTEDGSFVFFSAPYLQSVPSPHDTISPYHRRTVDVTRTRLNQALGVSMTATGIQNTASLPQGSLAGGQAWSNTASGSNQGIVILQRNRSGRITRLNVGGRIMTGVEFRWALINAGISFPSSNFTYTVRDGGQTIRFRTSGWGHGVGMSQYGAQGMARNGFTYDQILRHYYTGVELVSYLTL